MSEYRPFPDDARRNTLQALAEIPALVALLAVPTGGRVLEIGCGRGNALRPLRDALRAAAVVGLDLDRSLLEVGAAALARDAVGLVCADARLLPFADEAFDLVVDFGTCYHIGDPDRALREIARVLRWGGHFVAESRLSQLVAHPDGFSGARLPWAAAPALVLVRHAGMWSLSRRERAAARDG